MTISELPETLSVSDLATIKTCTLNTVYRRIKHGKLPPTSYVRPGVTGWHRVDIEPYLSSWTFAPSGQRVRESFGKPANDENTP